MKRLVLGIGLALLMVTPLSRVESASQFSEITNIDLLNVQGESSIAINGTATAYSYSFQPPRNAYFSLEVQFASSGSVNVKIEMEHGKQAPSTEGSSDTNFVIGNGVTTLSTAVTDTNVHFFPFSAAVAPFLRVKFTGIAGNDASTTVTRVIFHYARGT